MQSTAFQFCMCWYQSESIMKSNEYNIHELYRNLRLQIKPNEKQKVQMEAKWADFL